MRYSAIAVGCLLVSAGSLPAQRTVDPRLYVGARVRVTSVEPDNISGKLVASRAESLYVEPQAGVAPRAVALSNVRRLWVSQGQVQRRTLRGTMIGALAGGALFAATAAASGDGCENRPPNFDCMTLPPDPLLYFGVGALGGGVLGGTIGYFRRSERWERIR